MSQVANTLQPNFWILLQQYPVFFSETIWNLPVLTPCQFVVPAASTRIARDIIVYLGFLNVMRHASLRSRDLPQSAALVLVNHC